MNYLFFDTESVQCEDKMTHICSFGYIITDEKLNIIEKKEILINPCSIIDLKHTNKYIQLPYDFDELKSYKDFISIYPEIKSIFDRKDIRICGFSLDCDMRLIAKELKNNNDIIQDIYYLDVQKVYMVLYKAQQPKLSFLRKKYGIVSDNEHNSLDDTEATLKILKNICEESRTNISDLYFDKRMVGYVYKGFVHNDLTSAFPLINSGNNYVSIFSNSQFVDNKINNKLNRKIYCLSQWMEKNDLANHLRIFEIIRKNGGLVTNQASKCDKFIIINLENEENDNKYSDAKNAKRTIISIESLFDTLNIKDLDSLKYLEVDSIIGNIVEYNDWYLKYKELSSYFITLSI